ncbi:phosphoribosyltransferase [Streptomyces sp. N2-109]|uniref:Phosphoribosyltransferase n=1 Tax=Streptomyces gossypii TaxID=2883101 RepID=A0ABT2JNH5_9ACTN|nr:phosphoribosyltransferase [Streptomyces gossypii]MCT2589430.1 phosphoribosyltransferase [Streptomyces gossypii]
MCSQEQSPGQKCRNDLCSWSPGTGRRQRSITRIHAVARCPRNSTFSSWLRFYKADQWRTPIVQIFGRLLIRWMETHPEFLDGIDLVAANPTPPDRTPIRHIEAIVAAARVADTARRWPIPQDPVLLKSATTRESKDQTSWGKEQAAWDHAQTVHSSGHHEITDQRILLIDDVCTTGHQLNYVASRLLKDGAAEVHGLVLGRISWDTL